MYLKSILSERKHAYKSGPWEESEESNFNSAVRAYGKDWKKITDFVGTRRREAIYSHALTVRQRAAGRPKDPELQEVARILESK